MQFHSQVISLSTRSVDEKNSIIILSKSTCQYCYSLLHCFTNSESIEQVLFAAFCTLTLNCKCSGSPIGSEMQLQSLKLVVQNKKACGRKQPAYGKVE